MRPSQRAEHEMRAVKITRQYTKHAEGSVLVEFGDTKVICTASVQVGSVPRFLKGKNQGWLTAEYGMLPRSTGSRMDREAARGKQSGRTQEIQRLIGRSVRSMVSLTELGENTLSIDCDVIQADGGTRTAAITGACVAVCDAINYMKAKKLIPDTVEVKKVSAVSVGIYNGKPVLDLDYAEDSCAETDMNVIMDENLNYIEVQGTAEGQAFSHEELNEMLALARLGGEQLFEQQKQALASE